MTTTSRAHSPATVLAAAALLALTACTGPGPEPDPAASPSVPAGVEIDTGAGDAFYARLQSLVAPCMETAGFDYVPMPQAPALVLPPGDRSSESWVATYGFGLARSESDDFTLPAPLPDPNAAYIASLSAEGRRLYDEALYGSAPAADPADAEDDTEWPQVVGDGCIDQALATLESEQPRNEPRFTDLMTAMDVASSAYLDDPAMIALTAQWAHCMADAGFVYDSPEVMTVDVVQKQNAVPQSWEPGAAEVEQATFDNEVATALADLHCRQDLDWEATVARLERTYVEVFERDYAAELAEFRAAVEEKGGW